MNTFLLIVAIFVIVISSYQIVSGIKKKDSSSYRFGGLFFVSTVVLIFFHFLGWIVPIIVILGLFASLCTFLGLSGEEDKEFSDVGLVYCTIATLFYFISFYYWYQEGGYLTMAIALCILSTILGIHIFTGKGIPIMSSIMCLVSAYATVYVAHESDINAIQVFISGGLCGILLHLIVVEAKKRLGGIITKLGAVDTRLLLKNKKHRIFSKFFLNKIFT